MNANSPSNATTFTNDVDLLNYALTLEYLEAEMYRQAVASGKLSGDALTLAREFGSHEQAHVDALNATIPKLGGTPVTARQSYKLPAFTDQATIMGFISKIEDTGVGAYLGQVGSITSPTVLAAAASIYAVEALHASAIRTLMGANANPNGAFEKGLNADTVLAAAGPLLGPAAATGAAASTASTSASSAAGSGPGPASSSPATGVAAATLPKTGGTPLAPVLVAGAGLAVAGGLLKVKQHRAPKEPTDSRNS